MFSHKKYGESAFDEKTLMIGTWESFIPRSKIGNFTGTISIAALLEVSDQDRDDVADFAKTKLNISIDKDALPSVLNITMQRKFEDSKQVPASTEWTLEIFKKGKTRKKVSSDHWQEIVKFWGGLIPPIIYYPTFLFDFPARIYLTTGHGPKNEFFRNIVNNIARQEGSGLDLQKHIVDRFNSDSQYSAESVFNKSFPQSERLKIDNIVSRFSEAVSKFVLQRWDEIFDDEHSGRQVVVECLTEHSDGIVHPYLQFYIRDSSGRFAIDERSMGFRWFFCFILFTHFYQRAEKDPGIVFLFDEPASNLHSSAQKKLLKNFSNIASKTSKLIFTTHSHYLINPYWLEQAFIVRNKGDDPAILTASLSSFSDIDATPYRQFVGASPNKTAFFQPVLDVIQYRPADLEFVDKAVFVEGKSDYAILNYFQENHELFGAKIALIPCCGAHNMSSLISLYVGWGKEFVVLLDSDEAGQVARERYHKDYPACKGRVLLLADIAGQGFKKIENLLNDDDLTLISSHFKITGKPSKKQILAYFQESLATCQKQSISEAAVETSKKVLNNLRLALES